MASTVHGLPRSTPSLRLRHFVRDDAAAVMALNAEASTSRWLPSHVYATAEAAVSAVDFLVTCYAKPGHPRLGPYVLAVEHRESDRLLGHVGFSPLDDEVEVSYAIAESARGRGYGTESLAHACRWIADTFDVTRVVAATASANLASRRTLEKACFIHARDEEVRFQGVRQPVSRYCWHLPGVGKGA